MQLNSLAFKTFSPVQHGDFLARVLLELILISTCTYSATLVEPIRQRAYSVIMIIMIIIIKINDYDNNILKKYYNNNAGQFLKWPPL